MEVELIGSGNLEALASARRLAFPPSATEIERLIADHGQEAGSWAVQQVHCRRRVQDKFSRADEMLFDADTVEMATNEKLAAYHASRFPQDQPVIDLTVGAGADLIALAGRGPVEGFELDPVRADLARWNVKVYGREATVHAADGLTAGAGPYVFADPARRKNGQRFAKLEDFSPSPHGIVERFSSAKLGVMKLSPMLSDDELSSLGPRLEFVSFGGECREALVMWGEDVEPGRFAIHVETGSSAEEASTISTETPEEFLFDCDPALVRAHAVGQIGLPVLGDSKGYLTSTEWITSEWLRPYRVLAHHSADLKRTQAWLRANEAMIHEVKIRGVKLDGDALRKKLKPGGSRRVSLAVYSVGKSIRYVLLEAISARQSPEAVPFPPTGPHP